MLLDYATTTIAIDREFLSIHFYSVKLNLIENFNWFCAILFVLLKCGLIKYNDVFVSFSVVGRKWHHRPMSIESCEQRWIAMHLNCYGRRWSLVVSSFWHVAPTNWLTFAIHPMAYQLLNCLRWSTMSAMPATEPNEIEHCSDGYQHQAYHCFCQYWWRNAMMCLIGTACSRKTVATVQNGIEIDQENHEFTFLFADC